MTLLTEKYSSRGSNPQINMLGLLNLFLKDEPIAINPWTLSWGGGLMLFIPHSMTVFFNLGGEALSLTHHKTKHVLWDPHGCQDW